jgi:hypothetical protein
MDNDELHYPPGAEPEKPQEQETPEPEPTPSADPELEKEPETPTTETPATDEGPETDPAPEPEPQPSTSKPRSIYKEFKETKRELKGTKSDLEVAQSRVSELEGLLEKGEKAQTPADKAVIDDDIRAFAEAEGLDPEGLTKITEFLAKRLGGEKIPTSIQQELDEIKAWKAEQLATTQRSEEDRAIDSQAPAVRKQLKELGFEVHVDGEANKIMSELKRLAHTSEFHDKPVEYIVWAKRAELSKMISPKKASFEAPTPTTSEPAPADFDFSKGGITPEQASAAALADRPGSGLTFRKS